MQQTVINHDVEITTQPGSETQLQGISLEFIAYFLLITLALVFRVANLDSVPITPAEAPETLAAWRTVWSQAEVFPEEIATDSPAIFWSQRIGFTLFGGDEFAARILTALAGVALVFTPLLFRTEIGRGRTFAFCVLLVFSPVTLLAARLSAGMTWALLLAVVGVWALRRYWADNALKSHAIGAVAAFGCMVLLTEPGAVLLGIILLASAVTTFFLNTVETIDETPNPLPLSELRNHVMRLPVVTGLMLTAGVVIAFSTGFLTYPSGLAGIGELIGGFARGFNQSPADLPGAFALITSVFYEPLLWVFAGIAVFLLVQRVAFTTLDRFFLAWVGFGVSAILLYRGTEAQHALWLTIPLCGLASYAITAFFTESPADEWDEPAKNDDIIQLLINVRWAKWGVALVMLGLVTLLVMHLQVVGRSFLTVTDGSLQNLLTTASSSPGLLRNSLTWTGMTTAFIVVGGLLVASIWGRTMTLQSIALGFTAFMLIHALSSGWSAAVSGAGNPVELWHTRATADEAMLLRTTLDELAQRETMGYREIPITIVTDEASGLTRDGVIAWLVRDFLYVTYVNEMTSARTHEIVIARDQTELPDLGGSYVGQKFVILREWNPNQLRGFDFIPLWFQRQTRTQPANLQNVVLWVRLDVYESSPIAGNTAGWLVLH